MADAFMLFVSWLFSMIASAALVLWDQRRLWTRVRSSIHTSRLPSGKARQQRRLALLQLQRGWNCASLGAAIFAFAPLCIVPYFWVTRRSLLGILYGLLGLSVLLSVQFAFGLALSWVVDPSP